MTSKILLVIPVLLVLLLVPTTAFSQTDFGAGSDTTLESFPDDIVVTEELNPAYFEYLNSIQEIETVILPEVDSFQPTTVFAQTEPLGIEILSTLEFEDVIPRPDSEPIIVNEFDDYIQIIHSAGKVHIDKSNGVATIYDNDEMTIKSDSYVVRGSPLNTDDWFNLEVNDSPAEVFLQYDNYHALIEVIREGDEGVFIIETEINDTGSKTTAKFLNLLYEEHKFAFTEVLEFTDNIVKLNDQDIDLSLLSGQSFDRTVLEQNEDLFIQAKDFYFNAGLGFEYLWQVNVNDVTDTGYYPVSLDWANVGETHTVIGNTAELDPTYNWQQSSPWMSSNHTKEMALNPVTMQLFVYSSYQGDKIYVFNANNGTFITQVTAPTPPSNVVHYGQIQSMDFDSSGNLYVGDNQKVHKYSVSSSYGFTHLMDMWVGQGQWYCTYVRDLEVSHNSGNISATCYQGSGKGVNTHNSSGTFISRIATGGGANSVAVDSNDRVFAYDSNNQMFWKDAGGSTSSANNPFVFNNGYVMSYDNVKDVVWFAGTGNGSGDRRAYDTTTSTSTGLGSQVHQISSFGGDELIGYDGNTYELKSGIPHSYTWAFPPATPSAPTASTSGGINTVTWTADPLTTQYKVFRNGGLVATLGAVGTYTDSSVSGGTAYTYQLEATNSAGTSAFSPASNSVTPITSPSTPSAPTATTSGGINTVTWTAPANGGSAITDYKIYVSGTGISNYDFNTGNSATSWTHTNPVLGIPYQYQIVAYNSIGSTNPSSGSNFVTPSTAPSAPAPPNYTTNNGVIDITWTAPPDNGSAITGYQLWRNGASYLTLGSAVSYTDSNVVLGSSYYYQLQAINSVGLSSLSGVNSGTGAIIPSTITATPSAPVATFVSNTSNTVTWSAPANNGSAITNYELFRNGSTLGNVGNVLTYTDTGLTIGSSNLYSLKAINGIGSSLVSSNSNTIINANPPDAPTGLTAVTGSPITMTWTTPSSDMTITNYKIYRDGSLIDTLGVTTSYTDNTTSAGNSYIFEISAVSAAGEGNKSNSSTATHGTAPDAPTNLTVIYNEPNADLTWVAPTVTNGAAVIGYKIETSLDGANWSPLTVTTNTNLTYSHTNPTVGSDNYYRVSAINSIGTGVPGNVASALAAIIPTAPLSLTTTQTVPFFLDLSWSVPSDDGDTPITNYKVYRDGSLVTTLGVVTTYQDNTMQHIGHTHSYEVSAVNLIGESPKSNASSVTGWDVPSATTSVTATPRAGLQNEIDWTAPTSDGGTSITGYRIQSSTDNVTFTDVVASTTTQPYTHTGLTQGTTYYYKVSAINGIGEGTFGAASATVGDVPDAPASLTVVPQAGMQMTITVTIPNDNGYTISSYSLQRSTDNFTTFTVVGPQTSNVFVDYPLNIGTSYQYKALATNSLGDSALSSASATTVAGDVPSTPVAPGTVVALS